MGGVYLPMSDPKNLVEPNGAAGNECADTIVKYQAGLKSNNLTDTSIPSSGPGGNPFYNTAWLAWEEACLSTSESSSPIPNLIYFPKPPPSQTPTDTATRTPPSTTPPTLILPEIYRSR
eukprot:1149004-Pelagomonas_calceolata.AAC.1